MAKILKYKTIRIDISEADYLFIKNEKLKSGLSIRKFCKDAVSQKINKFKKIKPVLFRLFILIFIFYFCVILALRIQICIVHTFAKIIKK
jgi:hypothetical protein